MLDVDEFHGTDPCIMLPIKYRGILFRPPDRRSRVDPAGGPPDRPRCMHIRGPLNRTRINETHPPRQAARLLVGLTVSMQCLYRRTTQSRSPLYNLVTSEFLSQCQPNRVIRRNDWWKLHQLYVRISCLALASYVG